MQQGSTKAKLTTDRHYAFFCGLAALLALFIYRSFLWESLWLDECISAWVSSSSLSDTIARAYEYQGQSPLYYLLLKVWRAVMPSDSEFTLRVLSLFLLFATLFLVMRSLCRDGHHLEAIAFVAVALMLTPIYLALSARPYALAMFFCAATFDVLATRVGRYRLVAAAVLSSLAVYAHYYSAFAITGLWSAHLVLNRKQWPYILTAICVAGILCLPLLPQVLLLSSKSALIAFEDRISFAALFESIVPVLPVAALVIALAAVVCLRQQQLRNIPLPLKECLPLVPLSYAIAWWAVPAIGLPLLSLLTGNTTVAPRYFSLSAPAFAMILAFSVAFIRPQHKSLLLGVLMLLSSVRIINNSFAIEDWRGAVQAINRELGGNTKAVVLLSSGLAEARHIAWLDDPTRKEYLSSPLQYYRTEAQTVLLPSAFTTASQLQYSEKTLASSQAEPLFALISNYSGAAQRFESLARKNGFQPVTMQRGLVTVYRLR